MYSIIVSIYKIEKYLPQCIESILAQTYRNFELILVDDGSPDECPRICDEYAKKDPRIKVIHKKNGGSVSARKTGLNAATGNYICFIDGDDFVAKDMLETYEKTFNDYKVDVICTGYSKYYNEKNILSVSQKVENGVYNKKDLQEKIYPKMLSIKPFYSFHINPTVWSKCFQKSTIDKSSKNIPDNISLGDDVAVVYDALLNANSIGVIDYCGYMYRQNPNSMTHTYDKNLYDKIKNLVVYLNGIVDEKCWDVGNQLDEYVVFLLYLAKNNEFKYNKIDTYQNKKRNMKRYLKDPIFKKVIKSVKIDGIKNKFLLFCFKYHFILPIYLYEVVLQRGKYYEK